MTETEHRDPEQPNILLERLLRRRDQSIGMIDVRHAQSHYARIVDWMAERFPLLAELSERHGLNREGEGGAVDFIYAGSMLHPQDQAICVPGTLVEQRPEPRPSQSTQLPSKGNGNGKAVEILDTSSRRMRRGKAVNKDYAPTELFSAGNSTNTTRDKRHSGLPDNYPHVGIAVQIATEVGRNKPAQAGVSGELTGQMPETVAVDSTRICRHGDADLPLNSTVLPDTSQRHAHKVAQGKGQVQPLQTGRLPDSASIVEQTGEVAPLSPMPTLKPAQTVWRVRHAPLQSSLQFAESNHPPGQSQDGIRQPQDKLAAHDKRHYPDAGNAVELVPPPNGGRLGGNVVELTPPPPGGRLGGGRSESSEATDFTRPHPNPPPMGEGTGSLNSTVLRLGGGRSEGSEVTDLARPHSNPPPLREGLRVRRASSPISTVLPDASPLHAHKVTQKRGQETLALSNMPTISPSASSRMNELPLPHFGSDLNGSVQSDLTQYPTTNRLTTEGDSHPQIDEPSLAASSMEMHAIPFVWRKTSSVNPDRAKETENPQAQGQDFTHGPSQANNGARPNQGIPGQSSVSQTITPNTEHPPLRFTKREWTELIERLSRLIWHKLAVDLDRRGVRSWR